MFTKGFLAGAALMSLCLGAGAGEQSGMAHRVSCTVVRYYVAKYSAAAAEAWARGRGATDAEIEMARRCLPAATLQTASVVK
jgi:hypothetical protein